MNLDFCCYNSRCKLRARARARLCACVCEFVRVCVCVCVCVRACMCSCVWCFFCRQLFCVLFYSKCFEIFEKKKSCTCVLRYMYAHTHTRTHTHARTHTHMTTCRCIGKEKKIQTHHTVGFSLPCESCIFGKGDIFFVIRHENKCVLMFQVS